MTERHKAEKRALVEAWAKRRVTQTFAAKKLGMQLNHLNNYLLRNGIHWPVKKQGYGRKGKVGRGEIALDIDAVSDYYLDGFSAKDCGEKFGVHQATIMKRLKRAGVKIRPNIIEQRKLLREALTHRAQA